MAAASPRAVGRLGPADQVSERRVRVSRCSIEEIKGRRAATGGRFLTFMADPGERGIGEMLETEDGTPVELEMDERFREIALAGGPRVPVAGAICRSRVRRRIDRPRA